MIFINKKEAITASFVIIFHSRDDQTRTGDHWSPRPAFLNLTELHPALLKAMQNLVTFHHISKLLDFFFSIPKFILYFCRSINLH